MQANRDSGSEAPGRSLSEIVGAIVQSIQTIIREEVRLARHELKEKLRQSARAGLLLGAAALLGFLAAACVVATCVAALSLVLQVWLSTLLMGVLLGIGAGGAFLLGRMALEEVDPVPLGTVETIKDNLDWIRNHPPA